MCMYINGASHYNLAAQIVGFIYFYVNSRLSCNLAITYIYIAPFTINAVNGIIYSATC